jgi:hypothetical protein
VALGLQAREDQAPDGLRLGVDPMLESAIDFTSSGLGWGWYPTPRNSAPVAFACGDFVCHCPGNVLKTLGPFLRL